MAVGRPTAADPELPLNGKAVRVSQGKVLVGELLDDAARLGQLGSVEASDSQAWQGINEGQELNGPVPIVTAEEPPMPFCDYERGSGQRRWRRKQTAEQRVETVGPIQKGDEG